MEQRQTDRMVVRFVPAVLAVVEHRYAVRAVGIGQVGPLLGIDLVGRLGVVAAGHGAHAQVIGCLRVRNAQRELGLQQRVGRSPVHLVADVDAVVLTSLCQGDVLAEGRLAVGALHAYRGAYRALLHNRDLHVPGNRYRLGVDGLLRDLPGGPAERLVFGEERQAHGLALLHQFASVALVDDRANVAVGVERNLVDAVLERRLARLQGRGGLPAAALTHLVDGISRSRDLGAEEHVQHAVLEAQHLMRHAGALVVVDADALAAGRHRRLNEFRDGEAGGVVDHQRRTLDIGVQRTRYGADRRGQDIRELLERKQLVVPRELVGTGNARAGQVVVELVPDEALPRLGERLLRVGYPTEPVGGHGTALGGVGQQFVAAVVVLHRGLRRVAARGVYVHEQLSVPNRQFGMLVEGKVILEELVARGADDLDRAVSVHAGLHGTHRLDRRSAAHVARTVIVVDGLDRALGNHARELPALAQILIAPFGRIVVGVHHGHDARAVDTLPQADLERDLAVAVERPVAPHELLRREADQSAVRGDRRERPSESEAVREEDVRTLDAELVAVEVLPVEDVAREGLRGGDVRVGGIPRAAGHMPAALADVLLHQLILMGEVLLHPLVLDTALEVEQVVGVLRQQEQVLIQRLGNVLRNRALNVPVPLRVEVGVRDHVNLVRFLGHGRPAEYEEGQTQQDGAFFHHSSVYV